MLRRVLVPALAVCIAWTAGPAASAAASQASHRIVVLTVDGTSIEDWAAAGAFGAVGATGLLATRTGTTSSDPAVLRAAAYTTLGAGAPAVLEPEASPTEAGRGVLSGALGEALRRRGFEASPIGDASGDDVEDAPVVRAVMRVDGTISGRPPPRSQGVERTWDPDPAAPGGRRTDYREIEAALRAALTSNSVVVVDLGDTARADRTFAGDLRSRGPWIVRALADADRFAGQVRTIIRPTDTLIVASLVPPLARVRSGVHLGAVAISGARGVPFSGTTRRPGVLALTDLAPTILDRAGVPVPEEMQGRAARFSADFDPRRTALDLDASFVLARASRRPLTRIWLIAGALIGAVAFLIIAAGRGRAPGVERIPRRLRDLIATGFLATAAAPAAMLVGPLLGDSVAAVGWWTLAITIAVALVARTSLGVQRGLGAVALLDAGAVVGDLLAGTPLAARSPLGFQVAGGGRFYGVDEGLLGVLLAGAVIAAAAWVDGSARPRRVPVVAGVVLAGAAIVAGAPAFGSKFGAPLTLVPAFGVFVVLAAGRRIDRAGAVGIGIATMLVSGALAAVDALAAPAARSHIGREIAGETPVGPLVGRKLTSFLEITGTTIWLPVAIAIAVPVLVLLARRRNLLARGFWGLPGRRAALVASVVGCVAAMASNDTGIIVVAPALVMAAAAFYAPLLAPPSGDIAQLGQ